MATLAEAVDILSDNFETALAALIEHHKADALTSLAAVMRCHELQLVPSIDGLTITNMTDLIKEIDSPSTITANDIKPEKMAPVKCYCGKTERESFGCCKNPDCIPY